MDGAATPVSWSHQLAPAGTAGVINQPNMEVGGRERNAGAGAGQLCWRPQLSTLQGWDPFQAAPTPTPSSSCTLLVMVVGARVSYRLLPRGCSCCARSTDRRTQE